MSDVFELTDDLGPAKVIHIYEPSVDLKAILVVDNVARGPAIGGCRMAPDVTLEECSRLARAMTLKNAAADLPHGGGKSVVIGDPDAPPKRREELLRAMAGAIADVDDYIIGPDMGTDERAMAWVLDEIGRAVGLPREFGGIPLDELGATGWGLVQATEEALAFRDFKLEGARVAVQGFGAVGKHAARLLEERGATLVAAADSQGSIHNPEGLSVDDLFALKDDGESVANYADGERADRDAIIDVPCDIWIPAARPDVLTGENVDRLDTKLVVQGANIPATEEAEERLQQRDILNIPDFIANAGGVICAAVEHRGGGEQQAFDAIEEKIARNTWQMLRRVHDEGLRPRRAAEEIARERVERAMDHRRWSLG